MRARWGFIIGVWITLVIISLIFAIYYAVTDHTVYVVYKPVNMSKDVRVIVTGNKAQIIYNNQTIAVEDLTKEYNVNHEMLTLWETLFLTIFLVGLFVIGISYAILEEGSDKKKDTW